MAQTTIQGSFLGDATVTGAKIGADFISAQTELLSGLATTDELIVSDAGVISRMDISVIKIAATQITANGTLPVLNGSALTDLDAADLSTGAVPVLRLGSSGSRSSSTFLNGVNAWATPVGAVTALSGNVENRIATFGDTITELNGESTLTFGSGVLALTGSMTISTTLVATGTITTPSVLFKGTSNSVTIDADNPAAYTVILPNAAPTGGGKVLQTASGQATILEWGTPAAGLSLAGTTSGNQITTVNSSTEINGEATLTYDGAGAFTYDTTTGSTNFSIINSATSGSYNHARLILRVVEANTAGDAYITFHQPNVYEYSMGVDNADSKFKISGSALGTNDKLIIDANGHTEFYPTSANYVNIKSNSNGGAKLQFTMTQASGSAANGFIRWHDNAGSQRGYLGFGSSDGSWQIANENNASMTFATNGATRLTIAASGTLHGSSTDDISDARIKENVEDTLVGLAAILQLRPVKFNFKDGKGWGEPGQKFYGFLAQEVEAIIPEAVNTMDIDLDAEYGGKKRDPNGIPDLKSVTMTQITTALVKAIQELKAEVDALKG